MTSRLLACVIASCAMIAPLSGQEGAKRSVKATMVVDPNRLVPEVTIQLGSVDTSESLAARVLLYNATSNEVIYDRIESACNCRKIIPDSGRIAPGEVMELNVDLKTEHTPHNTRGGGRFRFYQGSEITLEATLAYVFTRHVGSPVRMLNVSFSRNESTEKVEIPFHVGEEVADDAFLVEFVGKGVDFDYSVNRENGKLSGTFRLKDPNSFRKLFAKLNVINLGSGDIQSIPVVLEREDAIQIHPRSFRFTPVTDKSRYEAVIYVRYSAEESKKVRCRATGQIDGITLAGEVTRIGAAVFKVAFSLSDSQVTELLEKNTNSKSKSRRQQTLELIVDCGGDVARSEFPLLIKESKK